MSYSIEIVHLCDKYKVMLQSFAQIIKDRRLEISLKVKDLVVKTGIDQALISKFESSKRMPTDEQLLLLSVGLEMDYADLRMHYLAEKVYILLKDEDLAMESLVMAEPRIEYLASSKVLEVVELSEEVQQSLVVLDTLHAQWSSVKGITGIRKTKMDEYFSLKYTYESNRIEGNTLTLSETTVVVKDGMTISGKSVHDHLEAINHSEAIELLYDLVGQRERFTKRNVMLLHGLILRGINKKYAGIYRDVPVRISGAEHVPPQPFLVDKLMEDYFRYYTIHHSRIHPVILAAEMHERLVSIHPFIDGNGRTARLVMNLILVMHGFPIAILKGGNADRQKYYRALEDVQVNDSPSAFYELVIEALTESIREHIELAS